MPRTPIAEDDPRWNPKTMGNKRYGPGARMPNGRRLKRGNGPGPNGEWPRRKRPAKGDPRALEKHPISDIDPREGVKSGRSIPRGIRKAVRTMRSRQEPTAPYMKAHNIPGDFIPKGDPRNRKAVRFGKAVDRKQTIAEALKRSARR